MVNIINIEDKIYIRDINDLIRKKLTIIPRLEDKERFETYMNNTTSEYVILLTDDIDSIKAIIAIIVDCCECTDIFDIEYIESFFVANLFLGRNKYDIPSYYQRVFLENGMLQLHPYDNFFQHLYE